MKKEEIAKLLKALQTTPINPNAAAESDTAITKGEQVAHLSQTTDRKRALDKTTEQVSELFVFI